MDISSKDIHLKELGDKHMLSTRAINICLDANLKSLNRILSFYSTYGSFMKLRNCGTTTNIELIELCKKNIKPLSSFSIKEQPQNFLEIINSLTPIQKTKIYRHFDCLIQNLTTRSINGLASIHEELKTEVILEKIFTEGYDFKSIKNIGKKSVGELEVLKIEFIRFVKDIHISPFNKFYKKVILKITNLRQALKIKKIF